MRFGQRNSTVRGKSHGGGGNLSLSIEPISGFEIVDPGLGEGFDGSVKPLLGLHRIQGIPHDDLVGEQHELVVMELGEPTIEQELLVAIGSGPDPEKTDPETPDERGGGLHEPPLAVPLGEFDFGDILIEHLLGRSDDRASERGHWSSPRTLGWNPSLSARGVPW